MENEFAKRKEFLQRYEGYDEESSNSANLHSGIGRELEQSDKFGVITEFRIANGAKVYRNQIVESTLPDDLEPYLLRHTFCTDCQAAGVPINVAKELMGHSDISVTAKIYTHMVDEVFEQNRKRLQEYAEHKQNQTVTA